MKPVEKPFEDQVIERWGTFSVIDHTLPGAFVADVLLYDRLVIPVPPDFTARHKWVDKKRKPHVQLERLEVLGDLAVRIPWGPELQAQYRDQRAAAAQVEEEAKLDYLVTAGVLASAVEGDRHPRPAGVDRVRGVVSYQSHEAFGGAHAAAPADVRATPERLGVVLAHEFLTPVVAEGHPDRDLLPEAVALARDGNYRKKRGRLYKWQEKVLRYGLTERAAVEEMRDLMADYRRAMEASYPSGMLKRAFLVAKVAAGVVPAVVYDSPLLGPVASAFVGVVEYLAVGGAPVPTGEAAVFHDAEKHLGWK